MVTVQVSAVPQWRAALERANEVRSYQRAVKARLKARELRLVDVLGDPACASMRVADVVVALPAVGPIKRDRVLRRAAVAPMRRLGELTDRQRSWLVELLGERA